MHLVMFALTWDEELRPIELDIVLGPRFLLTSHPPEWRPLKTRDVARLGVEHFLSQGTDLLLYAVVDPVVDGYFPVIDRLSDEIDLLEDQVVASAQQAGAGAAVPHPPRPARGAPHGRAGAGGLQPAHQPRQPAHRAKSG